MLNFIESLSLYINDSGIFTKILDIKINLRGLVIQWIKALIAKADNLSSFPRTHMVENIHVHCAIDAYTPTFIHKHIQIHTYVNNCFQKRLTSANFKKLKS